MTIDELKAKLQKQPFRVETEGYVLYYFTEDSIFTNHYTLPEKVFITKYEIYEKDGQFYLKHFSEYWHQEDYLLLLQTVNLKFSITFVGKESKKNITYLLEFQK